MKDMRWKKGNCFELGFRHPEVAPAALCKMRGHIICAIAQAVSRDERHYESHSTTCKRATETRGSGGYGMFRYDVV